MKRPMKHNIKNFVEQFCTPTPNPHTSIDENVAKYPNKAPVEVLARMLALEAANTRAQIAQDIQVSRIRVCRGDNRYSNFQFATRSTLPTVIKFGQSMLSILTPQAEGALRYAPPLFPAKEL